MDFATILSDMFPQVHRAVLENIVAQVGNQTENELSLVIDMILNYIKENVQVVNSNVISSNQSVITRNKPKISPCVNIMAVSPAVRVEITKHTGAIPKRPIRVNDQLPSKSKMNKTGIARPNHFSKMTLVRNTTPQVITDNNENIDFVDYAASENENKIFEHFVNMLPQADPTFLKEKARYYLDNTFESAEDFVLEMIEKNDYPSIDEYLGKMDEINTIKAYTTNFNLQNFIKQFPNASEHFAAVESPYSADEQICQDEQNYVLTKLLNKYRKLRAGDIEKLYKRNKCNVIKTCERLNLSRGQLFENRPIIPEKIKCTNLALLQAVAYAAHKKDIDAEIFQEARRLEFARAEASASNSFLTCACCYRDDLLPEDCVTCIEGCIFCRECVRSGAENCVAEAKTQYQCLSDCDSTFNDRTLQSVLTAITYQRLTQRRQMEEVAKADITGLEICPFCDYATIPAEEDKIFQCENVDCKKVSCRKCRHESHLPLRCEEIEYDEDVRMRTMIENRMTEAMLRFKCVGCKKPIIKTDGCNKITCPCGQLSCYVCKNAIRDYNHFREGGCQLYQNAEVSRADILQQAEAAKNELGINAKPDLLKFDPTRNF